MRLPVGPPIHRGGDRARLDEFRLRRGLTPRTVRPTPPPAWPPSTQPEPGGGPAWRPLGPFAIPHGRTAGFGPGSRPRVAGRVAAVAVDPPTRGTCWPAGAGLGEPRRRPDLAAPDRRPADAGHRGAGLRPRGPGGGLRRHRPGRGPGRPRGRAAALGRRRRHWRPLVADELLGAGFHDLLVDPPTPAGCWPRPPPGCWASSDGEVGWEPQLAGRCWSVSAGAGGELLAGAELGCTGPRTVGATWRRLPLASAPRASTGRRSPTAPAAG